MTSLFSENELMQPTMVVESSKSFHNLMNSLNTISNENASLNNLLHKNLVEFNDVKKKMNMLFIYNCKQLKHFEARFDSDEDSVSYEEMKDYIKNVKYMQSMFGMADKGYVKRMKERMTELPFSF